MKNYLMIRVVVVKNSFWCLSILVFYFVDEQRNHDDLDHSNLEAS